MIDTPLPASEVGTEPAGIRRCPICGKLSFSTRRSAGAYVDLRLNRARAAGLVLDGETPVGLMPIRPYYCDDGQAWHVTSQPQREFELPAVSGTLQDIATAIEMAISAQTQVTVFPPWSTVVERYGIPRNAVDKLRRALHQHGWLRLELPDNYVTVRSRNAQPVVLANAPVPELPLPPRPPTADEIPYVLVDAILRQPVGMKMPDASVLISHFTIADYKVRTIRRALCELGWLVQEPASYVTSRPDPSR